MRLLLALAQLCHDVYLESRHELGANPQVDVPVQSRPGLASERRLDVKLQHFRQAGCVWAAGRHWKLAIQCICAVGSVQRCCTVRQVPEYDHCSLHCSLSGPDASDF